MTFLRALAVAAALLVVSTAAFAQERGTVEGIEHGDRLVLAKGYGGLTGESRVLIASLSKAITGVCTATLIQDGKLRLDTPLGELLDRARPRYGAPRDARLRTVTIEQLLTHRAGFGRAASDPATGVTLREVLGRRAVSQATMYDLVPGVLRPTLQYDPGTTYTYTNASHLLLGVVIETLTGARYEDYCGYRLSPTSASGAINDSIGTRAKRAASGTSWFVSYEPRPAPAAREALDRDLYRAAAAVKAWPETDLYASLGLR